MKERLLAGVLIALGVYFLVTLVIPPPRALHFGNHRCRTCHGNRKLSNHSVEFQKRSHGPLALKEGASCLSCHQQESCDTCHQDKSHLPEWHNKTVEKPGRTNATWKHHAKSGQAHLQSCTTCHQGKLAQSCQGCHGVGFLAPP
jgi:hypothetical protein